MLTTICSQDPFTTLQSVNLLDIPQAAPLMSEEALESLPLSFSESLCSFEGSESIVPGGIIWSEENDRHETDSEEARIDIQDFLFDSMSLPEWGTLPLPTSTVKLGEADGQLCASQNELPELHFLESPLSWPEDDLSFLKALSRRDAPLNTEILTKDFSTKPHFEPFNDVPTQESEATPPNFSLPSQETISPILENREDKVSAFPSFSKEEKTPSFFQNPQLDETQESEAFFSKNANTPPLIETETEPKEERNFSQRPLISSDLESPVLQQASESKIIDFSKTLDPVRTAFQQIVNRDGTLQHIRIQLQPQHLGALEISFQFKGQEIFVTFKGEPEALMILKEHSHTLTQPLLESGFSLSEGSLDFGEFSGNGSPGYPSFVEEGSASREPSVALQKPQAEPRDMSSREHINILLNDTLSISSKGLML